MRGLAVAAVVGLAAACAADPADVSSAAPETATFPVTTTTSAAPSTGEATPEPVATTAQPEPSSPDSAPVEEEPTDGPVAFARRLLEQTAQWRGSALLGDCAVLELHEETANSGILTFSYEGGNCGGDALTVHLRYESERLVEEVSYVELFDGDPDAIDRFDQINDEVAALPTMCIDIPTNRLLAPDRWNGSCPAANPVGEPRQIVARVLQTAEIGPAWSDWCVDVFLDETSPGDGIISVAPSGWFGCDPTLQPRQFSYEGFALSGERTAVASSNVLGTCVLLEDWDYWPSVGPDGCRAEVVAPDAERAVRPFR